MSNQEKSSWDSEMLQEVDNQTQSSADSSNSEMLQEVDHQGETYSDSELPNDEDADAIRIIMGSQFNPAVYKPGSTETGALHEKSQRLVKCSCCAEAIVSKEKATIQCFKCHDKRKKKPSKKQRRILITRAVKQKETSCPHQ